MGPTTSGDHSFLSDGRSSRLRIPPFLFVMVESSVIPIFSYDLRVFILRWFMVFRSRRLLLRRDDRRKLVMSWASSRTIFFFLIFLFSVSGSCPEYTTYLWFGWPIGMREDNLS